MSRLLIAGVSSGSGKTTVTSALLATYLHVHFGSDPHLAPRFVAACREHPPC